jgi:hypothetical protein
MSQMLKLSTTSTKSKFIFPTPLYLSHILRFPVALKNTLMFLKR